MILLWSISTHGSARLQRTKQPSFRKLNRSSVTGAKCFVFALILETSRLASPTTALFERFGHVKLGDANRETKMVRKALTAVGDYAFGGLAAGIAGARALSNSKLRLGFPIYLRGGVYGSLLGLVGGLAQAALEVIKLYEEEEPHHDDPKAATDAAKK